MIWVRDEREDKGVGGVDLDTVSSTLRDMSAHDQVTQYRVPLGGDAHS